MMSDGSEESESRRDLKNDSGLQEHRGGTDYLYARTAYSQSHGHTVSLERK